MTYTNNKVNKILKMGLLLCLVALMPISAYGKYGLGAGTTWEDKYLEERAKPNFEDFFALDGSSDGPYCIFTVWDLCRLAYQVNQGNDFSGKTFKLFNDIDLDGALWCPIGVHYEKPFRGNIDGNGYTIKNMKVLVGNHSGDDYSPYSYGLIGRLTGVVKNLKMTNADMEIKQKAADNTAYALSAGLLCGEMIWNGGVFAAVYDCDIQGRIEGYVQNSNMAQFGGQDQHNIGGIVGDVTAPASIYHCHADVIIDVTNVNAGGIAGKCCKLGQAHYVNTYEEPWQSYIFDCTANVDITVWAEDNLTCKVGGICGWNDDNDLLACAATGKMVTYEAFPNKTYEVKVGGIAGCNGANIVGCASMVSFPYEIANAARTTALGGIAGKNTRTIANCVYSGHINNPGKGSFYGIVGELTNKAPVNCLFLGTMHATKLKEPLWPYDENLSYSYNYCDQGLYDDFSATSPVYQPFTTLTSNAASSLFSENGSWNVTYEWYVNSNITVNLNSMWQCSAGFYPRLQIDDNNFTNGTGSKARIYDHLIDRAADIFGDDKTEIHKAKLFPAYAWLASVPPGISEGTSVQFLDCPFSLALKQQEIDNENLKNARYTVSDPNSLLTITGETDAQKATPKDQVSGEVMLTITADGGISKQLCFNVNTLRRWSGTVSRGDYDGGSGTKEDPYLIHNARQLISAFKDNEPNEYYKLTKDIWFNDNLLDNTGEPKAERSEWNHESKRDQNNWYAHLDGDGHLVRGLFSINAFGLIEAIRSGASIENTGFVDCLAWSPEHEEWIINATGDYYSLPFGFLAPSIASDAVVRNCLFAGAMKERRDHLGHPSQLVVNNTEDHTQMGGLVHTIDDASTPITSPILEDCVVSVTAKSVISGEKPYRALITHHPRKETATALAARRVLVLNDNGATMLLAPDGYDDLFIQNYFKSLDLENCFFPIGYLAKHGVHNGTTNGKSVDEMTNGTFFTGEGFDKWTAQQGRFPMLKSFAQTAYGKLISLPIYTSADNGLSNMNYLLDFTPSRATWLSTNDDAIHPDADIRVLEPKTAEGSAWLVRTMDGAQMTTPLTTAATIEAGITFSDVEAKKFCLAHYDSNDDGSISLSELKSVTLEQLQQDMQEDDGNAFDNDGDLIASFPEFRYFAGISALGTAFQEKDQLQEIGLSGNITTLGNDAFRGTTSMTAFTLPVTMTSVGEHPFHNSGLQNYSVEADHNAFATLSGILTNNDSTQLISYPNGRTATSIDIDEHITSVASHAIYKLPKVDSVFINTKDYDYETVLQLQENAVTHASDGKQMLFFVEDATDDEDTEAPLFAGRRIGTSSNSNGHLLRQYKSDPQWDGKQIEPFFTLDVSARSKDANGNYWATMYIGFDTVLPDDLTPYIVDKDKTDGKKATLVLRSISRKIPKRTPIVVKAKEAKQYKLFASKEEKFDELPMSENLLDGINRNGLNINQGDANDGGCLTLGLNKSGKVGFFIYKGRNKIPAFRSYISVNKVNDAQALLLDEETTGIADIETWRNAENEKYYNLKGQRLQDPAKGINAVKGRKFIKK